MMNAEYAHTCAVIKNLEDLVLVLKDEPLSGNDDPRLVVAFEVALRGDDAELDQRQREIYWAMRLHADCLRAKLNAAEARTAFRAPLPAYATEEG